MPGSPISAISAGRALRLSRIIVSLGVLAAFCILTCAGAGKLAQAMDWSAKIQIFPTALVSCLSVVGCWLVITLVFGRLYCSTACPLGTLQDIAARLPRLRGSYRRNHPYHFAPARNPLRYTSFAIFYILVALGFIRIASLISPVAITDLLCRNIIRPAVEWLGGGDVIMASAYSFLFTLLILGIIGATAWCRGRLFCNTLCPVGIGLSIFSRFSVFHFDIDTDLCTNCRRCENVCKAQCINLSDHVVDGSRCVVCFDCTAVCPDKAIRYTTRRKQLSIPMLRRISPTVSLSSSARGAVEMPAATPRSHNQNAKSKNSQSPSSR